VGRISIRGIVAALGREGVAGAFVIALGVILWIIVRNDPRGELAEIGPGFMPWAASFGLAALGAVMVLRALRTRKYDEAPVVSRAAVLVPLGMAIFALGLEALGLFLTAALGVFVVTFASRESRLVERAVVAVVLATLVTLVFGYGLSMTMPLWPQFLRP
jgi:putative tricarboxylic transport membrane protein